MARSRVIKSTFWDPIKNLALEASIAHSFSRSKNVDHVLFLSNNTPAVLIGRHQDYFAIQSKLPLIRRLTGGPIFNVDPGRILFSTFDRYTKKEIPSQFKPVDYVSWIDDGIIRQQGTIIFDPYRSITPNSGFDTFTQNLSQKYLSEPITEVKLDDWYYRAHNSLSESKFHQNNIPVSDKVWEHDFEFGRFTFHVVIVSGRLIQISIFSECPDVEFVAMLRRSFAKHIPIDIKSLSLVINEYRGPYRDRVREIVSWLKTKIFIETK